MPNILKVFASSLKISSLCFNMFYLNLETPYISNTSCSRPCRTARSFRDVLPPLAYRTFRLPSVPPTFHSSLLYKVTTGPVRPCRIRFWRIQLKIQAWLTKVGICSNFGWRMDWARQPYIISVLPHVPQQCRREVTSYLFRLRPRRKSHGRLKHRWMRKPCTKTCSRSLLRGSIASPERQPLQPRQPIPWSRSASTRERIAGALMC